MMPTIDELKLACPRCHQPWHFKHIWDHILECQQCGVRHNISMCRTYWFPQRLALLAYEIEGSYIIWDWKNQCCLIGTYEELSWNEHLQVPLLDLTISQQELNVILTFK
jgi:hypothetical protein